MWARAERHHLDVDLGVVRHLDQVHKLPVHDIRPSDLAIEGGLVQHCPEPESARFADDGLALRAEAETTTDLVFPQCQRAGAGDDRPRVVGGLQEAGDRRGLVCPKRLGR